MSAGTQDQSISPKSRADGMERSRQSHQDIGEVFWTALAALCLIIALVPLFLVMGYVTVRGIARIDWAAFTELPPPPLSPQEGGFRNALFGTLIMVGIGALVSVPFGVLAAIYLSEFSRKGGIARWIRFATNVLSGVPSILMGVLVYGLVVLPFTGYSALAGGLALAVLMLPIIVRTTDEALQIVPQSVRWASLGLGSSRDQMGIRVVLPAALPAITTGLTLAVARAAGETAPLIFTALFTQFGFNGLFNPTASLSVLVYNFAVVPYENQVELAWAASFILVAIVLLTSIISRWATRKSIY
jgi:phosphate transport system permease protein